MEELEKLFIPYDEALELKQLGFDEPCFAFFNGKHHDWLIDDNNGLDAPTINVNKEIGNCIKRPLYSQAFKFFREKYGIYKNIIYDWNDEVYRVTIMIQKEDKTSTIIYLKENGYIKEYNTEEETELELLKKLIELCKKN